MKLYRFRYSPYARKVQMLLELLGRRHELIEVPYSDRSELASVTGGYIYVPVLMSDGRVTVESRRICERLLSEAPGHRLTPAPFEGPIWAYADFCDGPLEDVMFRIASPLVRDLWSSPGDRALYTLIKERKFGAGCIDHWQREQSALIERARTLLAPSLQTLEQVPFLFGSAPTLADAALYGNLAMLTRRRRLCRAWSARVSLRTCRGWKKPRATCSTAEHRRRKVGALQQPEVGAKWRLRIDGSRLVIGAGARRSGLDTRRRVQVIAGG